MKYNRKSVQNKSKDMNSKKRRTKKKLFLQMYKIGLMAVIAAAIVMFAVLFGTVKGIIVSSPKLAEISIEPSGYVTTICDQKGKTIRQLSDYKSNRINVEWEEMPQNLGNAFVAIEDERFYEHQGIDFKGMLRALVYNLKARRLSQGASTITQQLIKNNVFDVGGEKNVYSKLKRKIQEQYLALEVEKKYSKQEILKNYLNTINLGEGTLGVEAASLYYFDKHCKNLTLSECTVLAAITQNPTYYSPVDHPKNNESRRQKVLDNMLSANMITKEEYDEALEDNVYERIESLQKKKKTDSIYSYFDDALIKQLASDLVEKLGYNQSQAYNLLYSGGLTIYSTQDTKLQKIADRIANDSANYPANSQYALSYRLSLLKEDGTAVNYSEYDVVKYMKKKKKKESYSFIYSNKKKAEKDVASFKKKMVKEGDTITGEYMEMVIQPQISFSLLEQKTGFVKVLVGGRGEKKTNLSLNRATGTTRQPGSTFKVLAAFLPALDTAGQTLATVYDDTEYYYAGTDDKVKNWYSSYRGLSTIRDAITDSMNIVAAKTIEKVTPQTGYDYLTNLGFSTLVNNKVDSSGKVQSDVVQPLALGGITNGVTNLELTAAYGAIANKGIYVQPRMYTVVYDHEGNVLLENKKTSKRVMKKTTSWLLTNAMQDVIQHGTGKRAKLYSSMPVAGKTGTTSNDIDYWFSGYTPYYTASAWMGYDINKSFSSENYHKEIWQKIMDEIIKEEDQKVVSFPKCDGIVQRDICTKSGKLAQKGVCDQCGDENCIRKEYFVKGTEPQKVCDVHVKINICKESNLPANEYCPKDQVYSKVFLMKNEKNGVYTSDTPYILPERYKDRTCDIHTEQAILEQLEESLTDLFEPEEDEEEETEDGINPDEAPEQQE